MLSHAATSHMAIRMHKTGSFTTALALTAGAVIVVIAAKAATGQSSAPSTRRLEKMVYQWCARSEMAPHLIGTAIPGDGYDSQLPFNGLKPTLGFV
jgi:hypothetical protein